MPRLTVRSFLVGSLAATAVFAACSQPRQQQTLPVGPLGDTDPIAAIIERRPELQLADSQITVLRVIKRELDRVNRPLREELEKLGLLKPVDLGVRRLPEPPTREQQEKGKPFIDQIRENNRKARDAANEILTVTQRTRLDSLEARALQRRREQSQPRRRSD